MSRKYQMVCPKCKYEFTYDNGYLDENITRLGNEIHDILCQLSEHKMLPYNEQRQRTDWWLRTKRALAYKQKEIGELKAIRKAGDQQIKAFEYQTFKDIVKNELGEDIYNSILEKTIKEIEAYKISGLMRHEYSRSAAKSNVTSINKI